MSERGFKYLDKPVGRSSNQQQIEVTSARKYENFLGKAAREAKRNNDLPGYLAAVNAGYRDRGIENVDDKNARYRQTGHQRFVAGSAAVGGAQTNGGAQPNRGAQQPAGGQGQPPSPRASVPPVTTVNGSKALFADNNGDEVMKAALADREKTYRSNAALTGTQPAAPAKPKSFFEERASGRQDFVDTVRNQRSGEEGVTDKFSEQAKARGAALGLTPEQVQATLDGETELSPEAIAGRAKSRKDEAYQKEFGDSDKEWADLLEKNPKQKAMLEGLTPQQKKDSLAKAKESTAERNQQRLERETVAEQERDRYDPLGEALDSAKNISDETVKAQSARDISMGVRREIDAAKKEGGEERVSGLKDELKGMQRDHAIERTISGERMKDANNVEGLNLGEYNPSTFTGNDGKHLLPPADKIGGMSEEEIGTYVSKKRQVEEGKSKAFNEALGGKLYKKEVALTPDEKSKSDNPWQTHKNVEYTRDGFKSVKKEALGTKGTGNTHKVIDAQKKILDAAAKSGFPIWKDKELMSDPTFSRVIRSDPRFKDRLPNSNSNSSTPQASINRVNADELLKALDQSAVNASLMSRPLMAT